MWYLINENGENVASDILETEKTKHESASDTSDTSDRNVAGYNQQLKQLENTKLNLDVYKFIKVQGLKLNDQIVYDAHPVEGNITLVNNFLTGHLRVRGESGGRYPINYLDFIDRVFGPQDNTIEVCSNKIPGINKGGSCYTVDINPEHEPDLIADGQELKGIQDNQFNRWRSDPPYNEITAKEMYGTELPSLTKLLQEGARVIKPGSLMFLLCSKNVQSGTIGNGNIKRIGFITMSVVPNNETRVLNIYVKLPDGEDIN